VSSDEAGCEAVGRRRQDGADVDVVVVHHDDFLIANIIVIDSVGRSGHVQGVVDRRHWRRKDVDDSHVDWATVQSLSRHYSR